jgi:phage gpG-like protein
MSDVRFKFDLPKLPKGSFITMIHPLFKHAMLTAERRSKKKFLSGPRPSKLGVVSVKLRNSIKAETTRTRTELTGKIGTKSDYGPIHEFGGVIKAKSGGYLKFKIGGNFVQVKQVVMPARPFLGPAIRSIYRKLKLDIKKKIIKEWDSK